MENKKKEKEDEAEKRINKELDKILDPIFNKVLQEAHRNTMSVGVDSPKPIITFYWRPNNYRLQIPFERKRFNLGVDTTLATDSRQGSVITTPKGHQFKISNFGTKISGKFNGLPIMIDKNCITIIYSLKTAVSPSEIKKAVYEIKAYSLKDIGEKIDERVNEIKKECIETAMDFIRIYGGFAKFKEAKWIRHEDAIHKEDWIPDEVIIHDTNFKKVYPKEVEMKSPAYVKNFYQNRVIEQIAPEIAQELSKIAQTQGSSAEDLKNAIVGTLNTVIEQIAKQKEELVPVLQELKEQIKLHLAVQKDTQAFLKTATENLELVNKRLNDTFFKKLVQWAKSIQIFIYKHFSK